MVSVVIPVLNREETIEKCLKSLICQSYSDIEILIIDDGSTDKTCEIINGLAGSDDRIKLISGPKEGVAFARNAGIENAKGDLVTFIDSDDYVDPDYIKLLLGSMEGNDCVMSVCNYLEVTGEKKECRILYDIDEISSAEYIDNMLYGRVQGGLCWGKLYKRNSIKTLFEKYNYCEDVLFVFLYLADNPGSIKIVKKPLYNYYRHENSITGSKKAYYLKDSVSVAEQIVSECSEKYTDHKAAARTFLVDASHFSYLQVNKEKSTDADELRTRIKEIVSQNRLWVLRDKKASLKTKGACCISRFSFRLLSFMYGFIG